jgi:POT family proton-dependent oligopeptide transporter
MVGMDEASDTAAEDRSFFGHPKGLVILFLTEMWERFSYYGMRAMLVTYLLWHFLRTETEAYGIYAAYAGMIWLAPLIGGWLADKYLGTRRAVAFGAILITMGHFVMAYEGSPAREYIVTNGTPHEITNSVNPEDEGPQFVRYIDLMGGRMKVESYSVTDGQAKVIVDMQGGAKATIEGEIVKQHDPVSEATLFLALALIIVGTGFLKANISAVVGSLYRQHDQRRDSGFTIFYLGINLGALMGITLVGYLGVALGWSYGFGAAGIGMLAGLVIYFLGQPWLAGRGDPPDMAMLTAPFIGPLSREWCIYIASFAGVGVAWLIVRYLGQFELVDLLGAFGITIQSGALIGEFTIFDMVLSLTFIAIIIAVVAYAVSRLEREERDRMITLVILTFASIVFLTLFEQAPISLLVFQTKFVDTGIFTPQQIGLFNPAFIILFAPFIIVLWRRLAAKGREPSIPVKFALGLVQGGAGFLLLDLGIMVSGGDFVIGVVWVALLYLLHTTGELCMQPIGLSAVSKLSVRRMVGFMMGVWFLSWSLAQVMASIVSKATVVAEGTDAAEAIAQFSQVYLTLGAVSVAFGVVMWLASPKLKAMMHGHG